jgi:L-fuconolactonase
LRRPQLPVRGASLPTAVFMQADCLDEQAFDEVRWVESLQWPELAAIVAYAPVHQGERVSEHLARLRAEHPSVRGVRRLFQDEGAGFVVSAPVVGGLRETARAGLVFDATVRAVQLMELARVHDAVPELTLVVSHLGNPPLEAGLLSSEGTRWRRGLRAVAAHPGAAVKLSGAAAAGRGMPFVLAALEIFSPDRVMAGSDSPLSVPPEANEYRRWAASAGTGLGLADDELDSVRHGSAAAVYRIPAIGTSGNRPAIGETMS